MKPTKILAMTLVAAVAFASLAGCRTAREKALQSYRPRNLVWEVRDMLPQMPLGEGRPYAFALWERTPGQSLHLLRLAPDAVLSARYHRRHSLTLVCVSGSAIVEVEGTRHFLSAPASVVVPPYHMYKILPHKAREELVAFAVYSPPYGGEDVVLGGKKK